MTKSKYIISYEVTEYVDVEIESKNDKSVTIALRLFCASNTHGNAMLLDIVRVDNNELIYQEG